MPSRKIHNFVAKLLLPWYTLEEIDKINRDLDYFARFFGKGHRKIFGHELNIPTLLYLLEDPRRIPVWFIHKELDDLTSKNKELRILLKLVENFF